MTMPRNRYLSDYWAPSLSQVLFWSYATIIGIAAGFSIASGQLLIAASLIAAIFIVRIWLESTMILFEVRDLLSDIRDQSRTAAHAERQAESPFSAPPQKSSSTSAEHRLKFD